MSGLEMKPISLHRETLDKFRRLSQVRDLRRPSDPAVPVVARAKRGPKASSKRLPSKVYPTVAARNKQRAEQRARLGNCSSASSVALAWHEQSQTLWNMGVGFVLAAGAIAFAAASLASALK